MAIEILKSFSWNSRSPVIDFINVFCFMFNVFLFLQKGNFPVNHFDKFLLSANVQVLNLVNKFL